MSTKSPVNFMMTMLSMLALRWAPATSAVPMSLVLSCASMMTVSNRAMVATVGDAVSDLSYSDLCFLPSATVRPLSLPSLFSVNVWSASSA